MRPEVFFTQLHHHLLVTLVRSNVALETEDAVGEVSEQTVTQRGQLSKIITYLITERPLLAPNVAVELDVLLIILRNVNQILLDVLLILHNHFLVALFVPLEVFCYSLEVLQRHLCDFAVLV